MTVVLASVAFWAHAKLILPGDLGEKVEVPFKVRFKRLKTSERRLLNMRLAANRKSELEVVEALGEEKKLPNEWRQRLQEATTPAAVKALVDDFRIDDESFLDLLLVDWEVRDLRGEAVHFTPASRAELFEEWEGMEAATVVAYFDAFKDPKAGAKNSGEPSATT